MSWIDQELEALHPPRFRGERITRVKQISQETSAAAIKALVLEFDALEAEFWTLPEDPRPGQIAKEQIAIREATREILTAYPSLRMEIPYGHYLRIVA